MAGPSDNFELHLLSKAPLLITESADDFAALSAALTEEIKPRGIVARIFVDDIVAIVWEIFRLRRCKAAMINSAFNDALSETIYRLAGEPDMGTPEREWVDAVSRDWFSKPKARQEVLKMLEEFRLDEAAIEAEAIRSMFSELEILDRMLTSLESRRNRALRCVADYQFAKQVREASDRVIEGKAVVELEDRSARRSA